MATLVERINALPDWAKSIYSQKVDAGGGAADLNFVSSVLTEIEGIVGALTSSGLPQQDQNAIIAGLNQKGAGATLSELNSLLAGLGGTTGGTTDTGQTDPDPGPDPHPGGELDLETDPVPGTGDGQSLTADEIRKLLEAALEESAFQIEFQDAVADISQIKKLAADEIARLARIEAKTDEESANLLQWVGIWSNASAAERGSIADLRQLDLMFDELAQSKFEFGETFDEAKRQFDKSWGIDEGELKLRVDQFEADKKFREESFKEQVNQFKQTLGLEERKLSLEEEVARAGIHIDNEQLRAQIRQFDRQFGLQEERFGLEEDLSRLGFGLEHSRFAEDIRRFDKEFSLAESGLSLEQELGRAGVDLSQRDLLERVRQFDQGQVLQREQLAQQGSQFDQSLGLNLASLLSQPGFAAVADVIGSGQIPQGLREAGVNFLNPQGILQGGPLLNNQPQAQTQPPPLPELPALEFAELMEPEILRVLGVTPVENGFMMPNGSVVPHTDPNLQRMMFTAMMDAGIGPFSPAGEDNRVFNIDDQTFGTQGAIDFVTQNAMTAAQRRPVYGLRTLPGGRQVRVLERWEDVPGGPRSFNFNGQPMTSDEILAGIQSGVPTAGRLHGFQMPEVSDVQTQQSQGIFNQIPTAGTVGQLLPSQLQGLQGLLNFGGVSPDRFANLVGSVTPAQGGGFQPPNILNELRRTGLLARRV